MAIALNDKVNRYAALAGITMVSAAAFAMNAKYSMSLGSDAFEQKLMLLVSLGIDIYKFFGLTFIAMALVKRKWFKAMAASVVWIICLAYATTAAMGFATMTRSHVNSQLNHKAEQINHVKESFNGAKNRYETAKEEFETMKNNERYKSTAGCSVPEVRMRTESRYFCTDFKTQKEKMDALEIVYKEELKKKPVNEEIAYDSDPQMTFFATWFNVKKENLIQYWALALALVIETVSALGNFAVSPSRMSHKKKEDIKEDRKETSSSSEDEVSVFKKKRGRPVGSKNKPKLRIVS